jgi:hypothetical protein
MQGSCQPLAPTFALWHAPVAYLGACHAIGTIVSVADSAAPSSADGGTKSSRSRRIAVKARWQYATHHGCVLGDTELGYRMIAERDNETVKIERTSSIVIVAKARIWASEGWQVVITDADGKSYAVAEFDQLLAA